MGWEDFLEEETTTHSSIHGKDSDAERDWGQEENLASVVRVECRGLSQASRDPLQNSVIGGGCGGAEWGPQSGEGQQEFSGLMGGLSAPPSISPPPSVRHSFFCTHRK